VLQPLRRGGQQRQVAGAEKGRERCAAQHSIHRPTPPPSSLAHSSPRGPVPQARLTPTKQQCPGRRAPPCRPPPAARGHDCR